MKGARAVAMTGRVDKGRKGRRSAFSTLRHYFETFKGPLQCTKKLLSAHGCPVTDLSYPHYVDDACDKVMSCNTECKFLKGYWWITGRLSECCVGM